jgi:hypothetical protein
MRHHAITVLLLGFSLLVRPESALAALHIEGPASYTPGDIVELTILGDSSVNGDGLPPYLETGYLEVALTIDPSLSVVSSSAGTLMKGDTGSPGDSWLNTALAGTCGEGGFAANECVAVNAFDSYNFGSGMLGLIPSTLSVFQFDTTGASGPLHFSLDPFGNGFFGLPGTTFTVVPEPGTAGLLGLGLVVLARTRRRRS